MTGDFTKCLEQLSKEITAVKERLQRKHNYIDTFIDSNLQDDLKRLEKRKTYIKDSLLVHISDIKKKRLLTKLEKELFSSLLERGKHIECCWKETLALLERFDPKKHTRKAFKAIRSDQERNYCWLRRINSNLPQSNNWMHFLALLSTEEKFAALEYYQASLREVEERARNISSIRRILREIDSNQDPIDDQCCSGKVKILTKSNTFCERLCHQVWLRLLELTAFLDKDIRNLFLPNPPQAEEILRANGNSLCIQFDKDYPVNLSSGNKKSTDENSSEFKNTSDQNQSFCDSAFDKISITDFGDALQKVILMENYDISSNFFSANNSNFGASTKNDRNQFPEYADQYSDELMKIENANFDSLDNVFYKFVPEFVELCQPKEKNSTALNHTDFFETGNFLDKTHYFRKDGQSSGNKSDNDQTARNMFKSGCAQLLTETPGSIPGISVDDNEVDKKQINGLALRFLQKMWNKTSFDHSRKRHLRKKRRYSLCEPIHCMKDLKNRPVSADAICNLGLRQLTNNSDMKDSIRDLTAYKVKSYLDAAEEAETIIRHLLPRRIGDHMRRKSNSLTLDSNQVENFKAVELPRRNSFGHSFDENIPLDHSEQFMNFWDDYQDPLYSSSEVVGTPEPPSQIPDHLAWDELFGDDTVSLDLDYLSRSKKAYDESLMDEWSFDAVSNTQSNLELLQPPTSFSTENKNVTESSSPRKIMRIDISQQTDFTSEFNVKQNTAIQISTTSLSPLQKNHSSDLITTQTSGYESEPDLVDQLYRRRVYSECSDSTQKRKKDFAVQTYSSDVRLFQKPNTFSSTIQEESSTQSSFMDSVNSIDEKNIVRHSTQKLEELRTFLQDLLGYRTDFHPHDYENRVINQIGMNNDNELEQYTKLTTAENECLEMLQTFNDACISAEKNMRIFPPSKSNTLMNLMGDEDPYSDVIRQWQSLSLWLQSRTADLEQLKFLMIQIRRLESRLHIISGGCGNRSRSNRNNCKDSSCIHDHEMEGSELIDQINLLQDILRRKHDDNSLSLIEEKNDCDSDLNQLFSQRYNFCLEMCLEFSSEIISILLPRYNMCECNPISKQSNGNFSSMANKSMFNVDLNSGEACRRISNDESLISSERCLVSKETSRGSDCSRDTENYESWFRKYTSRYIVPIGLATIFFLFISFSKVAVPLLSGSRCPANGFRWESFSMSTFHLPPQ